VANSASDKAQVGAMGCRIHRADQQARAHRLGAPRLVNGRSEFGAACPTGPADSETAGTVTFLVMKIPFRRVVS